MDEQLKKRLIGATVLVSLAVIFIPMLLESEPVLDNGITESNIPPQPQPVVAEAKLPTIEKQVVERPRKLETLQPAPLPQPKPIETQPVKKQEQKVVKAEPKPKPKPQPVEKKPVPKVTQQPAVEKPKAKSPISSWVIQVGSFSSKQNAENLVKELRKSGYAAFMERAEVKSKVLYRVRVGPEADKKLAEKMLGKLNKALKSKKLVGSLKSYP